MVMPIGGRHAGGDLAANAFTARRSRWPGSSSNWALIAGALARLRRILTKLMADAGPLAAQHRDDGRLRRQHPAVGRRARWRRSVAADDAAIQLAYAQKIIIVPGYGLAAAQAQHQVAELAALLEERGAEVSYAIHPVAGRMPGHMNVLLAEANVPYPQLKEMEEINPEFPRADVALVIGANDVTNPAARRPGTAISGMPILDVDQAKSIIVIKRSMGHGYAGIDNELYVNPKTSMLFADAKSALTSLIGAVKTLVG
jgi:NAD(P) transhydrogenase subunit beta